MLVAEDEYFDCGGRPAQTHEPRDIRPRDDRAGGGQPLHVWVGVNAEIRKPVWFGVPLTRTHSPERTKVSTQAEKEVSVQVTLLSSHTER
jgi:hypothetical protein